MTSFLGSVIAILNAFWIMTLVRGHKLMLKFALPWLTLSIFGLLFSSSELFRNSMTSLFGFEQPSNLFLSFMVLALGFLGILLGIEVTNSVTRLEKAASAIAIIDSQLEDGE